MIYILIALQLLDLITTVIGINSGKGQEANPVLAPIIAKIGVVPAMLAIKLPVMAYFGYVAYTGQYLQMEIVGLLGLYYAYTVFNNIKIIRSN